jgi:hypothetical protein
MLNILSSEWIVNKANHSKHPWQISRHAGYPVSRLLLQRLLHHTFPHPAKRIGHNPCNTSAQFRQRRNDSNSAPVQRMKV